MEYKTLQFKADDVDPKGKKFAGLASTGDLDRGKDVIIEGAFTKTLSERAGRVKLLWNHRSDLMPIGKPEKLEERNGSLYIEGAISETSQGKDASILLADGVLTEMSIGYTTKVAELDQETGIRTIKELELFEISLVNFPMNEAARITAVKNLDVRELEHILREAGYTNSQAKCMANSGIKSLREADTQDEQEAKQAALLAELDTVLKSFKFK